MCFLGMMLMGFFVAIRKRILMDASQKVAIWLGNHSLLFCNKSALHFYKKVHSFLEIFGIIRNTIPIWQQKQMQSSICILGCNFYGILIFSNKSVQNGNAATSQAIWNGNFLSLKLLTLLGKICKTFKECLHPCFWMDTALH